MKKRFWSFLIALGIAFTLLPTTGSAVEPYRMDFDASLELPVAGEKPATVSEVKVDERRYTILKVEWSGELDANGCFKEGVAYTVTITERINEGYDGLFMKDSWLDFATYSKGIVVKYDNKGTLVSIGANGKEITVSCALGPAKADPATEAARKEAEEKAKEKEHWEAYKKEFYTEAQANAAWWKLNQQELIMDGSEGGNAYFSKLDNDDFSNITRLLLDYPNPSPDYLTAEWPDYYENCFHNIQEVWLSPKVDAKKFFDELAVEAADSPEGVYKRHSSGILNGMLTIFVPDTQLPKGLLSYSSSPMEPTYSVKVYSGDVYEAYKQGASAGRDWCPGHDYTGKVQTASRMAQNITCQQPNLWYYSCKWCGKCEYNPSHTFSRNSKGKDTSKDVFPSHEWGSYDLSAKNYIGTNERGEKVYSLSCIWCGISYREDMLNYSYAKFLQDMGAKDNAEYRQSYQYTMDVYKKSWAVGGDFYNLAMKSSVSRYQGFAFAVPGGRDVTAKVSGWAQNEVNWAAQNDLIDAALLGGNYTGNITRLQFCSVAVKMAEKMLGKSITPAPAGTFSDTDNEYVRKAYAAGITTGSGGGKFNPGGALTRQEMAAFLYRALMYVKKNSDIKYTIYDSKLGNYSDSSKLAVWAKEPMAFMNALGLINGTGGMLSPAAPCTIEQALLVANRSLSAEIIGWYQSLGGTEKNTLGSINKGGSKTKRCFYTIPEADIPADGTFNQLRYLQSERFWVTGAAQTQDWITRAEQAQGDYIRILKMLDPYTGDTLYIQANDFRPIKAD